MLKDGHDPARQAAAKALGQLCDQPDVVVPELSGLLEDEESDVVQAAAEALTAFGAAAATALPHVLTALKNALIECDDTDVFMAALNAIVPDAEQQVRQFFSTADPELQHQMQAILFDRMTRKVKPMAQARDGSLFPRLRVGLQPNLSA